MDYARMSKTQLIGELKKSSRRVASVEAARNRLVEKDKKLRQGEELFRLISENAGDLIAVLDLNGRRLYNSASYQNVLGDPERLRGTDSFNDIHPEDRTRIQKVFEETVRTGIGQRSEYRFLLRDGTIRYIESMGNLIRDENGNPSKVLVVSRDVTEMRYSDRKIRLLAQTVASTKDCVNISDLEENILFVNDAFLEAFGYAQEELLGKKISSLVAPSMRTVYTDHVHPSTITGGWNGMILGKRKDGTEFPQELWTSLVRNEAGEPVAIVGVARDITDRMQAEKVQQATYRISEATQSEQTFEGLLHSIHEIIGGILPANNFYIALYDKKNQLLTFPYFVDECDPRPEPKQLGKGLTEWVLRTGKPLLATPEKFEELVIAGEVEQIGAPSIDWLGVPLMSNEKTIGVLVVQSYSQGVRFSKNDIEMLTFVSSQVAMSIERRRALESLRESEARFRAVFERSGIGMAMTDLNGRLTATNKALHNMLGYGPAELRQMSIEGITLPDDIGPEMKHFRENVTSRSPDDQYVAEKRYRHKNGSIVWGRLTSSFIPDAHGTPLFGIGMVEDITMRKRVEERLSKLNDLFLSFGADPLQNINRLTALCGELMGATCAFYNRLESGMLCAWGQWQAPPDFSPVATPTGHICYDVIQRNEKEVVVIRGLSRTPYAHSDPNVLRYNLHTYVGHPVHFGDNSIGSLCMLYDVDFVPTDDDKRLIGIIASAIGVEEQRKQAAESVQESEFRYRSLFENANDAIFLMRDERFIDCNRKTEEMFGFTKEQVIGNTPFEMSPEYQPDGLNSKDQALAFIHAAHSGEPQHFEWQHERSDGTLFDAEVSLNPLEIKGERIIQAIVRDITARKRAEESLRESELRFSTLAEAAFEGIGISDEGKLIIASNQLAHMLGYQPGEMIGMPASEFVAPESRDLVAGKIESGETEPYEHLAIRKDGSVFPVEVRARALPFKGQLVRVSVIRDITDRKRAQAALENSEKRFRALIEHSSDAIGMMDRHGTVVYESPASRTMLGYAPNELTGHILYDFVHPDEREEDVKVFSELLNHPRASIAGQFQFKHKAGSWRWLDVVATNLLHEPAVNAIVLNYRDVTERKLAQEELYRSRQMLRIVLDNIPQRVFWKDRNINYLGCNKSFAIDAGFQDPMELAGKSDFELVWKEVAAIYRADDADVMETNTAKINYEEPLTGTDGRTLWLKTSKIPMHDQEGNVIGVLGTYEDITDRKRAQEEILLQKTRFQQLYENVSLGIAMIDEEDRILAVNPAFTRIFQYDVEELRGRRINEVIVPPEFAQEGEFLSEEARHGRPIEREGWRKRKDGELVFVRIYGVPITSNGETIGIYGIYEDISQRKRAEDKVHEQAALLDVSRDAIGVQDLEGRVLYWNKGAELLYEIPASEIIGKTEVPFYKPESLAERRQALENVIRAGEWSGEMRHMSKSGKELTVQSRWSLVRDQNGQPRSILVVATDITEKKKLEAQFHHAQRLETIGTLAGGIAHDLNNVLAPILMSIELLENKLTDEKSRRLVSTIESSAKRGSDIVKQVLTFARGIEGERVNLQAKHLLRDMERIALETFPKSIEIHSDIPKTLWTVRGDATQLHQVLLNLCINARDAMPQGGILEITAGNVELDQEGTRIHLNAHPGRYVTFSVSDTGVGMPPEIMDKIFDPFFTTKEVGKGTGLGLSTVLGIVESHKGFITVKSTWGKGSEFTVYIPAVTDPAAESVRESPPELPRGNGELILVVDDEASVREIMRESLESYGYRVVEAKDGMEAAVVFEKQRGEIKLVITDMMMPTMDGAAVIRLLRRMNPTIKIVVVTGMAEEDQVNEATKKNVQGFLQKPFRAEKLLKAVDAALNEEHGVN